MKKGNRKKMLTYIACGLAGIAAISFVVVMLTRPENPNEKDINSVSNGDIFNNHIYHKYDKSFIVDADITSTAPEKTDILYAKYYQPNEKKLWSEIFGTDIPKREISESSGSVIYDDRYEGKGNYMIISEFRDYIRGSRSPDYIYTKLATDDCFSTKYESWGFEDYPNPSFDTMYKKENLDFMSSEDAIDYTYTLLKNLNIEVSKEDVEIYAIDLETLQKHQDELVEKNPNITGAYGDPKETFKETFEDDDEFYIICFTAVQNQIPVTHSKYSYAETRSMYGSNIKVYLSKSGIFRFNLTGVYQTEGVVETAENFITVQEALDKAYKENVLGIKMTVDEVRFEYAPVPYNSNYDEVKLTPAWTVHMHGTQVDGHELHSTMMIDAVTGEKIG